ncbi:surface-adhesin E family protein [Polynucleobacter necessarius]|uniref:surface-adhesin E family protein n=1 Tax=Polynucleobacter necessarius TaxID=576610 RepID=UPI000FE23971|nr:surface-adhesin E family protein [Polynucleobacter necessarius]
MKLSLLSIASLLLTFTNLAHAEWKELGSNEVMVVYVDLETISTYGELTQIVSMLDLKKPGVNPTNKRTVGSIIGLNEYNCPEVSYRPIAFKEFSGSKSKGAVVSDVRTPDSKFEPVVSESWAAGVFNVLCKIKK